MTIALDADMAENTPKIVFPSVQKEKVLMPPTKFCQIQWLVLPQKNTHYINPDPYFPRFNATNVTKLSKILTVTSAHYKQEQIVAACDFD